MNIKGDGVEKILDKFKTSWWPLTCKSNNYWNSLHRFCYASPSVKTIHRFFLNLYSLGKYQHPYFQLSPSVVASLPSLTSPHPWRSLSWRMLSLPILRYSQHLPLTPNLPWNYDHLLLHVLLIFISWKRNLRSSLNSEIWAYWFYLFLFALFIDKHVPCIQQVLTQCLNMHWGWMWLQLRIAQVQWHCFLWISAHDKTKINSLKK